jgi:hypothetical protein
MIISCETESLGIVTSIGPHVAARDYDDAVDDCGALI